MTTRTLSVTEESNSQSPLLVVQATSKIRLNKQRGRRRRHDVEYRTLWRVSVFLPVMLLLQNCSSCWMSFSSSSFFTTTSSMVVNAYVDESSGSERRHQLLNKSLQDHYYSYLLASILSSNNHSKSTNSSFAATADDAAVGTAPSAGAQGQQQKQQQEEDGNGNTDTATSTSTDTTGAPLDGKDDAEIAFLTYFYASQYGREGERGGGPEHNNNVRKKTDRSASLHDALPVFPPSKRHANLQLIQEMFMHGWDSYLHHAFPYELRPLSCQGHEFDLVKLPGLTMVDSLDMLAIMGNWTEFARSLERVRLLYAYTNDTNDNENNGGGFAIDQNVSVFETNIRVLGGLLSAHQLAEAYLYNNDTDYDGATISGDGSNGNKVLKEQVFDEDGRIRIGPVALLQTSLVVEEQELQQEQQTAASAGGCNNNVAHVDDAKQQHDSLRRIQQHDFCTWLAGRSSFYEDVIVTSWFSVMNRQQQQQQHHLNLEQHENKVRDTNDVENEEDSGLDVCANIRPYGSRHVYNASKTTTTTTTTTTTESLPHKQSLAKQYYQYDGFLLRLALDLGNRLLPAFYTPTGIPYGTVNLLHGVPSGETPVASLAGGGTLSLEFHLLSRLSGDDRFARAAKLATRALFLRQSNIGLFGKHIDVRKGHWAESLSGIGSNSDSFLEYLAKHYFLFPSDADFWTMLVSSYSGVFDHLREGEWYVDADMSTGIHKGHSRRVLESLMAFYPGMQVLLGESVPAARSANSFFLVREWLGFLPERFSYPSWKVDAGRGAAKHPLRPELLESGYFLHRATRGLFSHTTTAPSSGWLWAQDFALHKLEKTAKVKCGYAGVSSLDPETSGNVQSEAATSGVHLMDEMPSFFLSETLKYLYLTFDEDNILHRDDDREWIFTTEAHPIHYVSKKIRRTNSNHKENNSNNNNKRPPGGRFSSERETLKQLLRERIRKKTHRRGDPTDHALRRESWSERTTLKSYRAKLSAANTEATLLRAEMLKDNGEEQNSNSSDPFFGQRRVVAPFVPDAFCPTDFSNDLRQGSNVAHLSFSNLGVGQGQLLKRTCPNFYSSDLLWLHALNGGAFDYSEIYVSVSRDTLEDHPIDFVVLGAAEALGVHGTGVYPGDKGKYPACPLPDSDEESSRSSTGHSKNDGSDISKNPLAGRGDVIQIQSEFGLFEVIPEADGSGFYIHLVDTGETLLTTFFDGFAMIYSDRPTATVHSDTAAAQAASKSSQSPWHRMGSRLKSILSSSNSASDRSRRDEASGMLGGPTDRRVVLADYEGNMFSCEVEVFETYPDEGNPDKEFRREVEVTLASFPCAPARFGLTDIQLLAKSGGISIQAEGTPPQQGDEKGCMRAPMDESSGSFLEIPTVVSGTTESIQIVRRGECSFYSKAVNQRMLRNSVGMIVISDSDNDIFVMTAGEQGEIALEPENIPVSVLMTGLDGEELLEKLTVDKDDDEAKVGVRISITRQPNALGVAVHANDVYWPMVVGSSGTLNVYVQGGWGIQATKRSGRGDWQLQLLRSETAP